MSEFKRISPQQAQELRAQGAVVVDIRDPHSFANRLLLVFASERHGKAPAKLEFDDLDAPLIGACYHGNSSQGAAAYLAGQGFSEVYSLDGGFELWRATYPSETAQSSEE